MLPPHSAIAGPEMMGQPLTSGVAATWVMRAGLAIPSDIAAGRPAHGPGV